MSILLQLKWLYGVLIGTSQCAKSAAAVIPLTIAMHIWSAGAACHSDKHDMREQRVKGRPRFEAVLCGRKFVTVLTEGSVACKCRKVSKYLKVDVHMVHV